MSGYVVGANYFGSASLLTSVGDDELIQQHKPTGIDTFEAYKFSFINYANCTVKINGSDDAIYLNANQGFSCDYYDAPISTFTVVTAGIHYNYIGAYK